MRHISHSARQRVAKRRKKRLCLVIGLALVLFALQQIDQAIRPLTRQVVQYQCRAQAVQTIQTACNSILEQNSSLYEDLYTVQRDDTGRVQSVAVNSARINTLEDALVEQVNQSLYQLQQLPLHIPLGTLTGIQLFSNLCTAAFFGDQSGTKRFFSGRCESDSAGGYSLLFGTDRRTSGRRSDSGGCPDRSACRSDSDCGRSTAALRAICWKR